MNVLLLHPEDDLPASPAEKFDLVVDLGRAPVSIYQEWAGRAGCRVISLFDFAREREDVLRTRDLFQLGAGWMLDGDGIDWWEVLCPLLLPDFMQALLLQRLAEELKGGCRLYASRPDGRASALRELLGAELACGKGTGTLHHYRTALSRLSLAQVAQICQDRFDPQHRWRRRLAPARRRSEKPVVLLPSAYINVSRTAISYAALAPERQFLLVVARRQARLSSLPSNVAAVTLDSYYPHREREDAGELLQAWNNLQLRLASSTAEFKLASDAGLLRRIPSFLRWSLAARDAWKEVFESENISACFSADDANPYTSLPLILARSRGLPALACHHGAMDYRMAIKRLQADVYLAKGELERDYLTRECGVSPDKIAVGCPASAGRSLALLPEPERKWLTFFTEPYGSDGWRVEEVYRDLLPGLRALADSRALRLVLKLHPFESVEGHRRLLRKIVSREEVTRIHILAGPISPELWRNTRLAIATQSTVAMEAAVFGIPVFLCGWLRSPWTRYIQQYVRFGIGHVLESSRELSEIPQMSRMPAPESSRVWHTISPKQFHGWLAGSCPVPAASAS